jgi:hypothetical protein
MVVGIREEIGVVGVRGSGFVCAFGRVVASGRVLSIAAGLESGRVLSIAAGLESGRVLSLAAGLGSGRVLSLAAGLESGGPSGEGGRAQAGCLCDIMPNGRPLQDGRSLQSAPEERCADQRFTKRAVPTGPPCWSIS